MFVRMVNLYNKTWNIQGHDAWYRKLGDCFDFVNRKEFASDLTEEEARRVMEHADWFCNQYGAEKIIVEELEKGV